MLLSRWLAVALALVGTPTLTAADPLVTGSCPVPSQLPATRTGGDLTVQSPPRPAKPGGNTRLRSHVVGSLGKAFRAQDKRVWAGLEVPDFVPLAHGTLELFLLDNVGDRYMAFYRDPYDAGSCKLSGSDSAKQPNCAYAVSVFDCAGTRLAHHALNPHLSKSTGLEIQDIRYADGVLYFNEACASYSKEQGGQCSALVAIDATTGKRLWRTKQLVSNHVLLVHGDYVITGYGFTSEPASLSLIRRSDGAVVAKQPIKALIYPGGAPDWLELVDTDVLRVGIYGHPEDVYVKLVGLGTSSGTSGRKATPRFQIAKEPAAISNRFHPDGTENKAYEMPPAPRPRVPLGPTPKP